MGSLVLVVAAFVVAGAAAVRSTWSPCGLSMLSSITPVGERGRGNRFRATATWFVVGAVLGGACLGALAAGGAAVWGALGLPPSTALVVGGLAALFAATGDAGWLGLRLPLLRRQVNEVWLDQFRGWVYGVGFGWQIGAGFTTYLMTLAVPLTVVLAVVTGQPLGAFVICTTFGLLRGLAVLAGARAVTPDALRRLHRDMERLRHPVQVATAVVSAGAGVALAVAWWWPALVVAVVPAWAAVARLHRRRHHGVGAPRRSGDLSPSPLP